jgi:hypothetical protein
MHPNSLFPPATPVEGTSGLASIHATPAATPTDFKAQVELQRELYLRQKQQQQETLEKEKEQKQERKKEKRLQKEKQNGKNQRSQRAGSGEAGGDVNNGTDVVSVNDVSGASLLDAHITVDVTVRGESGGTAVPQLHDPLQSPALSPSWTPHKIQKDGRLPRAMAVNTNREGAHRGRESEWECE